MAKLQKIFPVVMIIIFWGVILFVTGCSEDNPTQPEPPVTDHSEVIVSCLGIALVSGGTQIVCVSACDKNGNPESFTVTSGNTGVASVIKVDTTFTVTGISYGSTNITVTSSSSKIKEIPVTVYNPQILETEELIITFAQTFEHRWSHGVGNTASAWHPLTTDGFKPLGTLCYSGLSGPDASYGVMVVKAKTGSDALAAPTDYTLVPGSIQYFWIPVPPAGYKAMGIVVQYPGKPSLNDVVCVREDLTIPGETGDTLWWIDQVVYAWRIEPPIAGPHENAYLSTGTHVMAYQPQPQPPSVHPVMNVLNVKLPMLIETPYQQYVPTLKGFDPPPNETVPILTCEMLVPCTIVSDPLYTNNQMWRVTNSPFYRLERQVFYKLLYHNYNQTSITQHNSYTKRYGVTTEESNEFWAETSISVTVEAGISIKIFDAKVSTTVSKSFGYSTMTSVSELEESEYESGVDVVPGKAVAIWQRWNRFILKRHNGTSLETVKAWDFGINSFITDEYPDE